MFVRGLWRKRKSLWKSVEWIMEKRVFDMTWKDLSRRKCGEESYQFQAGGRAGGPTDLVALH